MSTVDAYVGTTLTPSAEPSVSGDIVEPLGNSTESSTGTEPGRASTTSGADNLADVKAPPPLGEAQEVNNTVNVTVNGVLEERAKVIGQIYNHQNITNTIDKDRELPVAIPRGIIATLKQVFVRPPEGTHHCQASDDKPSRLRFVVGERYSGRFSYAVSLGLDLLSDAAPGQLKLLPIEHHQGRSLHHVIEEQKHDIETRVYLIEDVFTTSLARHSFSLQHLTAVSESLEARDAYLILTTTADNFPPERLGQQFPQHSTEGLLLDVVLERHLEFLQQPERSIRLSAPLSLTAYWLWPELARYLHTPSQIAHFAERLISAQLPSTDYLTSLGQHTWETRNATRRLDIPEEVCDYLRGLAADVAAPDSASAAQWFRNLSPNARFCALLVGLFEGLDRHWLGELYSRGVDSLREGGLRLADVRETGWNDLFEEIRVRDEPSGIRFVHDAYRKEVARQIGSYERMLWSVLDTVIEWLTEFRHPEFWRFRAQLGTGLGRLGVHAPLKLEALLTVLASVEHGGIASVPGHALREVCLTEQGGGFATSLLHSWAESKDPRRMWAAAAAVWRVFEALSSDLEAETSAHTTLINELRAVLTHLAGHFDRFSLQFLATDPEERARMALPEHRMALAAQQLRWSQRVFEGVVRACIEIGGTHPRCAVALLQEWLQCKSAVKDGWDRNTLEEVFNRWFLAGFACGGLFASNRDVPRLEERRHAPLLELIDDLLGHDQSLLATVLDTLRTWISEPEWKSRVFRSLLLAVNQASADERQHLRAALAEWQNAQDSGAREMADTLLVRSAIMDGQIADLPGGGIGVLLLDATGSRRRSGTALGFHLYETLRPRTDLQVFHLGHNQPIVEPSNVAVSESKFSPAHAYPRCCVPPLEAAWRGAPCPLNTHFVAIVNTGRVHDLEDLFTDSTGVAVPGDRIIVKLPPDTPPLRELGPNSTRATTDTRLAGEFEARIDYALVTTLARRSPEVWWNFLRPLLPDSVEPTPESVFPHLEQLIGRLDELPDSSWTDDPARIVLGALQWLARVDLRLTGEHVTGWLEEDDTAVAPTRLAIGFAAARVLLRVSRERLHIEPAPVGAEDAITSLFSLGAPLARHECLAGLSDYLELLFAWISVTPSKERLRKVTDPEFGHLHRFIDALGYSTQEFVLNELREWVAPKQDSAKNSEDGPSQLSEWLNLRIILGPGKARRALQEGQKYGLLLFDAGQPGGRRRAEQTLELFRELEAERQPDRVLLVYRLGEMAPVALSGDRPTLDGLFPAEAHRRPPSLLCPLLAGFSPSDLQFFLLVADQPPLDHEDLEDAWHGHLFHLSRPDEDWPATWELIPQEEMRSASAPLPRRLQDLTCGKLR